MIEKLEQVANDLFKLKDDQIKAEDFSAAAMYRDALENIKKAIDILRAGPKKDEGKYVRLDSTVKLANGELRNFLETGKGEIAVLIEPTLVKRIEGTSILGETPETVKENEMIVEQTKEMLTEVLNHEPKWVWVFRTFVVKVTPDQLKSIIESDLVRMVWLNRNFEL